MRLFIALNLPDAVRQAVRESVGPLRDLGLPVRWVQADGLHLTLKFLGEVEEAREAELIAALGRAAGAPDAKPGVAGITITLRGFGAFPSVQRPRVVWIGVEPEPALELLGHRVEQQFAPLGFPTEARPFRPHLTLGRAHKDARVSDFRALPAALEALRFDQTVAIGTVDLMQSTLQSSGAVYHTRHRERLS